MRNNINIRTAYDNGLMIHLHFRARLGRKADVFFFTLVSLVIISDPGSISKERPLDAIWRVFDMGENEGTNFISNSEVRTGDTADQDKVSRAAERAKLTW